MSIKVLGGTLVELIPSNGSSPEGPDGRDGADTVCRACARDACTRPDRQAARANSPRARLDVLKRRGYSCIEEVLTVI
jgi:hypothetical protein